MNRMLSLANGRSELSDSFIGLPVWLVSISARRWTSLSRASASFSSSALRSPGVVRDHFLKAARAASTARSTSAAVPFGTLPTGFSVAGLITSIRWREEDSTSLPSMIILRSVIAGLLRDPGTGTPLRRIGGALRHACPIDDGRPRSAQSSKDRGAGLSAGAPRSGARSRLGTIPPDPQDVAQEIEVVFGDVGDRHRPVSLQDVGDVGEVQARRRQRGLLALDHQ